MACGRFDLIARQEAFIKSAFGKTVTAEGIELSNPLVAAELGGGGRGQTDGERTALGFKLDALFAGGD